MIDAQQVYCSYKSDGCGWIGERGQHEEHLKQSCEFCLIECEYGCSQKYVRLDTHSHFANNPNCFESMERKLKNTLTDLKSVKKDRDMFEVYKNKFEAYKNKFEVLRKDNSRKNKCLMLLLIILTPIMLGYMYTYWSANTPKASQISTEISQFVVLKSDENFFSPWQLNIQNYWLLEQFATLVNFNGTRIDLTFGAKVASSIKHFKASVII